MKTSKISNVGRPFLIEWPTLIPYSNTGSLDIKALGPTKMRLKYILSLQVRQQCQTLSVFFKQCHFQIFFTVRERCLSAWSSWCNVKLANIFSLERLKGSLVDGEPDLSLVHNNSICMDAAVAKSLFNTTCLRTPIIPVGLSMRISRPFMFYAIILSSVALILGVMIALLALYVERTQKRKNAATMTLHANSQSHSATARSASNIEMDSPPPPALSTPRRHWSMKQSNMKRG